ncbi:MAG: DUF6516 family protein [Nitrospirota bacterium]
MIENYIEDIIQGLSVSHAVSSFHILKIEIGEDDGYIRIRCKLTNGDILEFAEYIIIYREKIYAETYSYHWQSADGRLKKRWDNVPHHKDVDSFPNHLHLPDKVVSSNSQSLKKVLADIETTLEFNNEGR